MSNANPHTSKKNKRFLIETSVVVYRADYIYATDAVEAHNKARKMIEADEFGFISSSGPHNINSVTEIKK